MPSWWSPSGEAPAGVDRAVLFRPVLEASRRAEIVALVESARTGAEVARVTVEELCEALEAEVGFVLGVRPGRGGRGGLGQVGLRERDVAAVAEDPLCTSASAEDRPVLHAGEDLLGLGARRLMLAPWTAEDGRRVVLGVARLDDEPFDDAERALLEAVVV